MCVRQTIWLLNIFTWGFTSVLTFDLNLGDHHIKQNEMGVTCSSNWVVRNASKILVARPEAKSAWET